MLSEEELIKVKNLNKQAALKRLLELLQVCPQVIPPKIGIEAYLNLLDEGAELILNREDFKKPYPVD